MLAHIQGLLTELYDLAPAEDVERFVCGPDMVREVAGEAAEDRGEVLLVLDDADGVHVALYLAPDVLASLERGEPDFRARCLAMEGVSHFLYLSFRADNDEQVSQLELELQAEVDKYAAAMRSAESLAGFGVGAIRERSRAVRARLFERARFIDAADTEEGERYRVAHAAAARYAARLEERHVETGRLEDLWSELRRFYRLGAREKLETARG